MNILKQHLFLDTIGCSRGGILLDFDPERLTPDGRAVAESLMNEWNWPARYGTGYTKSILCPFGLTPEPEKPVITEPIWEPEPWDKLPLAYMSPMYDPDDGLYKLFYTAKFLLRLGEDISITDAQGNPCPYNDRLCYAYSENGRDWIRPELPYYLCNGRKTNMLEMDLGMGTVFIDIHHRETGKFKAFDPFWDETRDDLPGSQRVFTRLWGSDNGLDWYLIESEPLNYFFDTQNVMNYDEELGLYVAYFRGHYHGRSITRSESEDPARMPMPVTIMHPDNFDPPDIDYYTNGFTIYPHDKSIRLLFPSCLSQQTDHTKLRMAVSRNGRNFQWVSREYITGSSLPNGELVGSLYASPGMIAFGDQVAMIVWTSNIRHDEYRITSAYDGTPEEQYGIKRVRLALWERDRLAGFTSGEGIGETFIKVKINGTRPRLQLNLRSEGMGHVSAEVLTGQTGEPLVGYALSDGDGLCGDLRWADYVWKDHADLSEFDGQEITLRFHLESAKLFGFRIVTDDGDGTTQEKETERFASALETR